MNFLPMDDENECHNMLVIEGIHSVRPRKDLKLWEEEFVNFPSTGFQLCSLPEVFKYGLKEGSK